MIRKTLYLLAALLVIAWSVLFLKLDMGGIYHLLLVAGAVLFVMGVLTRNEYTNQD